MPQSDKVKQGCRNKYLIKPNAFTSKFPNRTYESQKALQGVIEKTHTLQMTS